MSESIHYKLRLRDGIAYLNGRPAICCYCGVCIATTIDHCPPIGMFVNRKRPKGLEVPACRSCNRSMSRHDFIASIMARTYTPHLIQNDHELQQSINTLCTRYLPYAVEMLPGYIEHVKRNSRADLPKDIAAYLRCDGPLVASSLYLFAARMGAALQFSYTREPIPKSGSVCSIWFTSSQLIDDKIPEYILDLLQSPSSLKQGTWHVDEQFKYKVWQDNNTLPMICIAAFGVTFMTLAICSDEPAPDLSKSAMQAYSPELIARPKEWPSVQHLPDSTGGTQQCR